MVYLTPVEWVSARTSEHTPPIFLISRLNAGPIGTHRLLLTLYTTGHFDPMHGLRTLLDFMEWKAICQPDANSDDTRRFLNNIFRGPQGGMRLHHLPCVDG